MKSKDVAGWPQDKGNEGENLAGSGINTGNQPTENNVISPGGEGSNITVAPTHGTFGPDPSASIGQPGPNPAPQTITDCAMSLDDIRAWKKP